MNIEIDYVKMRNLINQDPAFYKRFKEEWEEITNKLRKAHELSKIREQIPIKNSYRVTSSSVIFK